MTINQLINQINIITIIKLEQSYFYINIDTQYPSGKAFFLMQFTQNKDLVDTIFCFIIERSITQNNHLHSNF